jgi:predicted transcriptional regulator
MSMSRVVHRYQPGAAQLSARPALQTKRPDSPGKKDESRLGEREREVLAVLWQYGSATVQQVAAHLSVALAYTTVMTTLDRLFKKGFAQREKQERAFLYSAAITKEDMERRRASVLVHHFFERSSSQQKLLVSHLVDAVDHYDTQLLDQLEDEIRSTRSRRLLSKEKA